MFIIVTYKDPPELSLIRQLSFDQNEFEEDPSLEKKLLINPKCPVRVMLEYIRAKCKLAASTKFDLCDDQGNAKNLFSFATYTYANQHFVPKKVYYLIIFTKDSLNNTVAIPQINHGNKLYLEIQTKLKKFISRSAIWETGSQLIRGHSTRRSAIFTSKAGKKK